MSFVPIFWNTETQQNLENKTSKIYGSHIAYKKQGYDWTSISNDVQTDLSVTAFAGNVQFPTTAQGWMDICFNGEYSAKRQITEDNWINTEDEFNIRMRTDTPTNSVGIIHPDKPWQVIYYNAFAQGVNLIYGVWRGKQCRVEHVIEITEMPAGDSEYLTYDFYVESADATAFIGNERPWDGNVGDSTTVDGFSVFIAKGDDFNTPRGSVLRTPVCWWTNLDGTVTKKDVKIDFEIQPDGITVKATKYVKRSDIAEALAQGSVYRADATFSPDADPESATVDGRTVASNKSLSWADMIIEPAGFVRDSAITEEMKVWADNLTDKWDLLERIHMLFDTSSIGAGQQVDSASLAVSIDKVYFDDLGLSWNIYSTNPSSNTALVTGDHANVGTTPFSTARTIVGESTDWTTITMNFNGDGESAIAMQGISKFAIATREDRENADYSDPTWVINDRSGFKVRLADNGSNIPVLTVTHSEGGGGGGGGSSTLILKDRVKETTATTGTGTINLAGAATGFEGFVSAVGDGNTCYYTILDANGSAWEVGIGTVTDAATDTLSRDTILESSNSDSGVDLSAGTHTAFLTYPADKSVYRNTNDQIVATSSGVVFSDATVQTTAPVTYTAGTGLLLSGTEFNVSGVDTSLLQGTVANNQLANSSVTITAGTGLSNGGSVALGGSVSIDIDSSVMQTGDNVSLLTNDAGYLTTESDTLQTVTDRGSNTTNSITSSGNITATTGILDVLDLTLLGNGSQPAHSEGVVFYDSENHTLSLYNDEADVTLQLGQEEFLRVRNNTGGTIYNGSGVRITGAHGASAPTVVPAIATTEAKGQVVGLATHNIENETFGYVTTYGIVRDINTVGFSAGDELFLDATTSGNLTNVSPVIPNYKVRVGHVIRSHTNGSILVNVGTAKLGGGDAKVVNSSINLSGIPYYTEIADTNAGGLSSNSAFLYDSGNNQLQLGSGVQLLNAVPGNTTNVLYNDGGTLKFNGSAVETDTLQTVTDRGAVTTNDITVSGELVVSRPEAFAALKVASSGQQISFGNRGEDGNDGMVTIKLDDDGATYAASSGVQVSLNSAKSALAIVPTTGDTAVPRSVFNGGDSTTRPDGDGVVNIKSLHEDVPNLIVYGKSAGTSNLSEWKDSNDNTVASIGKSGVLSLGASTYQHKFDRYKLTGVTSSNAVAITFGGSALSDHYSYRIRCYDEDSSNLNGSVFLVRENNSDDGWDVKTVSIQKNSAGEFPEVFDDSGTVKVKTGTAGARDIIVYIEAIFINRNDVTGFIWGGDHIWSKVTDAGGSVDNIYTSGVNAPTNVGINTETPAYALDVNGTGNFSTIRFSDGTTQTTADTNTTYTAGTGLLLSGTEFDVSGVDTSLLQGTISTAQIADNAVTLAKLAGGTDGQIITFDANGDPVAVGPGTDGQVLTSTGAGSPPAFEDASGGGGAVSAVANGSDNRVATFSSSDALNGEANLTFDGTDLTIATGSIEVRTIDYSDGDNAVTIADGGAVTFAKSINQAANTATDGGAVDIDCATSNYHEVLMNANATSIVFTNVTAGQRIIVRFKQHSSHIDMHATAGWNTVTVNGSSATVKWGAGVIPTLTESNNAIDVYGFIFESTVTNVMAFIIGQDVK